MANLRSFPLCALAGALLVSSVSIAQTAASNIAVAPANRILNPIDESQLITLKGTVHPLAIARNDRGVAPDSLQLSRMHVVLKRSDSQEAALKQLIGEMHTPGSANYHKWLTPDQFAAQFGPSDQDLATVTTWLTGHGFSVTKVNPGRQTLEISGNVAQLRNAFHTQIHKYSVNGETRYANANDPQIPSALAPVVAGFVSLNNFPIKSYAHPLGKAQYDPKTDKATPQWTIGSSSSLNFVLAPQDYAVQYDLNPLYTSGINGAGQTIAIVNDSNINVDLVNQFRTLFSLPANPPQVIVDGNDPGVDGINNPGGPNGDSVEAYLDVEWAGAVAPNATVDLVIAADTALENGLILAAEHAVYGNVAPIISLSFGNCESALGSSNAFLSALWEQAAAQGITVLVSTGDAGSAGCDNDNSQSYAISGQAVNGFASTPYNVAVGGTDFYYSDYASGGASIANYWSTTLSNTTPAVSIKGVIPEQPWNSSQFGLNINSYYSLTGSTTIAGGGGGASNAALCSGNSYNSTTGACTTQLSGYAKPAWQTGTGVPSDGVRDLPDVSLFAASGINASYYPICAVDGDCQPVSSGTVQIYGVGGTSASTPAFAGIMALVNQKYGRQGQADTVLYPLAKQFPASFHDVTAGTISMPCEFAPTVSTNCIAVSSPIVLGTITEGQIGTGTTPEYTAAAGYDLATGWGTIDAYQLVTNWGSVKLASTTTTITPSSTSFAHGTGITITGSVTGTGTPTGNVALMTDSTEQVQQGQTTFTLSNGSYTSATNFPTGFSTLPGGTYNIWAQYGGDSANGLSTSPKTQITVTPEASGIYFNAISSNNGTTSGGHAVSGSVDYGAQMILSAQVAPNSQLSAFESCTTNCPVFTTPTGTVTFSDSTAGSGLPTTAVINAEGDAEFSAPFAVGSHSVTASYSGDQSYNSSTASAITFTVVKDTPQILYNSPAYTNSGIIVGTGQPSVISFQVENNVQYSSSSYALNQAAAPTGTLAYSSSPSGISGSVTLSSAVDPYTSALEGVANIPLPTTTKTGTYSISVTYSGDSNYYGESGSISVPIIGTSGTASTIAATMSGGISPNSTLTITGTVTGVGSVAPTSSSTAGTGVLIYASNYDSQNNGNYLGEVLFSSSSGDVSHFSFTFSSQSLPQGTNLITLQYTGDSTYAPSATVLSAISNPLADFTLVPNTTIVPVTAGSNGTTTINLASVNGFSGTVNLTCTAASGITCAVPASATLTNGGNATATLTVSAPSGTSSGNYNVLITGKDSTGEYIHTLAVTADVSGTASGTQGFTMTNSGAITIVAGATSGNTATITVAPTNGFTGNVALSCAVTTSPSGATSPITCSIPASLNISGTGSASALLTVNSTATTTGGNYVVTVTGTSGSTTQTTTVNVAVSVPGFTLANSGSISMVQGATSGNTSTITATPTNGFTGAVALTCAVTTIPTGATSPVTCAMSPGSITINGSAQNSTLTVSSTASTTTGAYAVTVTGASGSITQTTVVSVTVTSAVAPSYALSNSGSISVSPGATTGNTSTITVTPSGGFTGTVNLTCAIAPTAASDPATCSLSPTSVSITSGALTSTLTVTTTAATAFNKPLKLFWPSTGGAVLALLFFFVPRRRRNWLAMVGLLVLVVSGFAIGCGGGGSSGSGGTTPSNPGTTAGTYTVTVTGTSGSTTKTTTVTLTVL